MNREFTPHTRFISKTTYFLKYKLRARDCRFVYFLSGEGEFETEDNTYPIAPHTLIYYPCGMSYHVKASGELFFYTLNFDFSSEFEHFGTLIPEPAETFDFSGVLNTIPCVDAPVFEKTIYFENAHWAQELLEHIYSEKCNQQKEYKTVQNLYLKILITEIYRRNSLETVKNPLCEQIKNIARKDLTLNIKEIAELLHYHPFYLNQVFKKSENCSLHNYITRNRLLQARELISTTPLSIEEIALLCGFSSHAHLSTAFKKEFDISPSHLRKQF